MTEGEKSSGKSWDGSDSDWFSVKTMKTLLMDNLLRKKNMNVYNGKKKELTAGSWCEKERALESRLSRGETIYRAAAMSETPKNRVTVECRFCILLCLIE